MPASPQERPSTDGTSCFGGASVRLTWLLALLAALTLEVAVGDGDRSPALVAAVVAGQAAAVWLLCRLVRLFDDSARVTTAARALVVLGLATTTFGVELILRRASNSMLPLELLMLSGFRNGVLALAAFAHRVEFQRTCCALSTFLMIFASALSGQLLFHGLVVLFAVAGIWWLMGSYWATLHGRLAASSARSLSRRWWIALPLCVVAVLALVPLARSQTHALQGFMPSSGGSRWYSETARSGVGDGDALVAGTENIRSFAPIEDAPFLNSHEPTLYDLFDDTYDEPAKPSTAERAITLPPQLPPRQKEHDLAQSLTAGREFSTLRKTGRKHPHPLDDRDSPALLYVKGRVPLHLKLEVFDRYDGIDWFPEELPEVVPQLFLEKLHGRPWLRAAGASALELYGLPEVHVLKIIRLDTNRIPSPTQFLRLHLDQLDRTDLFAWAQPTVLKMDRKKLPSLTVMHLQSRIVDDRLLSKNALAPGTGPANHRQYGDDEQSQRVRELARRWIADLPSGWPQVRAIIARLRDGYAHDRSVKPAVDSRHTVSDFLFDTRRGPDYQFASAAVWLLRSQGYAARLVSGFYVEPSRFETRSQHTPVLKQDVHFWAEVHAGLGHWVPVEPTPGYELLTPVPTLVESVHSTLASLASLASRNIPLVLTAAAGLIWLGVERRRVADALVTAWWSLQPAASDREFVRKTLCLLEGRFRRAGLRRPPGTAASRWLSRLALQGVASERRALLQFTRLADWACFAPSETLAPFPKPAHISRNAGKVWAWKTVARISVARPDPIIRRLRLFQSFTSRLQIFRQRDTA